MRTLSLFTFLFLAITWAATGLASSEDIVIGFLPSSTGSFVLDGSSQTKALNLALKKINAAGGVNGRKIRIESEDNESTDAGMVAAYEKLVNRAKPVAIIGSSKSPQGFAISAITKKYGLPTIIAGTNPALTESGANKWFIRVRPSDTVSAHAIVRYIKEDTKFTKLGFLYEDSSFGKGGLELVEKYSKAAGLNLVAKVSYKGRDRDFKKQIAELAASGAEAVIVYAGNSSDCGMMIKQYRELDAKFAWFGSPTSQYRATLRIAQDKANGIVALSDFVPEGRPATQQFIDDYKKEYSEEIEPGSIWIYDALNILAAAIKTAGTEPEKLRAAILNIKNYDGALGTYSFLPNGDGLHEVAVVKIEGGVPKLLRVMK